MANTHNYHHLYGHILRDTVSISGVCEIGLGSNHLDVVSNMGESGRPGASLRAFKAFCPNADIYGANIDRRILFKESRIETFFVDQTDPASFNSLAEQIPGSLNLIIDDGLHSPDANLNTLRFALSKINIGGWAVIEDISPRALPLWQSVSAILPHKFEPHLFEARGGIVFGAKRRS